MPPVDITFGTPIQGTAEIMGYAGALSNTIGGTRYIEATWPSSGETIRAIEAHINVVSIFLDPSSVSNPIIGGYPAPDYGTTGAAADGTWTMTPAFTLSALGGDAERAVVDFDGWATFAAEYIAVSTSGATSNRLTLQQDWTSLGASEYIDVRAKLRRSDWYTDPTNVYTIASAQSGAWLFRAEYDGSIWKLAVSGTRPSGGGSWAASIPMTDVDPPVDEWVWLRFTNSSDGSVRFYTSSDGASWTLVGTVAVSGGCAITTTSTANVMAGIYNSSGAGFGGDIADLQIYDLGGGLLTELGLGGFTYPDQELWTVPGTSQQWRRGASPSSSPPDNVYGTSTGTLVATITFPTPPGAHTVRFGFDGGGGTAPFADKSELVKLIINPGTGGIYVDGAVHL